jgi:hypothetical protein
MPLGFFLVHLSNDIVATPLSCISAEVWEGCQLLPMQQNLPKFAQNCPNLPKFAQKQNFEIPSKIEILVFIKNKNFDV